MALSRPNTNIYGQQQSAQQSDIFGTLKGLMSMQDESDQRKQRQLVNEKAQRELDDDYVARETIQQYGGDYDGAIDALWRAGRHKPAMAIAKGIYEQRESYAKAKTEETKAEAELMGTTAQMYQAVHDDTSFQMVTEAASRLWGDRAGELRAYIGSTYDPERVRMAVAAGTKRSEYLTQQKNGFDAYLDFTKTMYTNLANQAQYDKSIEDIREKQFNYAGQLLSTANNAQEWDYILNNVLTQGGTRPEVLAAFGEYGPGAARRAAQMAMDPKARAELQLNKNRDDRDNERLANENERVQQGWDRIDQADARRTGSGGTGGSGTGRGLTPNAQQEAHKAFAADWQKFEDDLEARYGRDKGTKRVKIPPEDQDRVNADKVRLEDNHRAQLGLPPLFQTEGALMRDESKKAELATVRHKIRVLTDRETTPLEEALALTKQIRENQGNPQVLAELQKKLDALNRTFGLRR